MTRTRKSVQLPEVPTRIGIVTSATGAAVQDMLNTISRRFPLAEVILCPTPVQGVDAPSQIIRALQRVVVEGKPDVVIVARGGGSLEDLWAFNDEQVVRAIASLPVPMVTGIGHETDFTLADFAADLRAPTPTAAAELVTPNRMDLAAKLLGLSKVFAGPGQEQAPTIEPGNQTNRVSIEAVFPALKDPDAAANTG